MCASCMCFACAGAVVICLLLLVWRQYLRTQPGWLRERVMQSKRTKGAPKCTKASDTVTVSIVVTDVKDFSELTRKCPELMSKAMGGHNNILRKACHMHAGYVMDQVHSMERAVDVCLVLFLCCSRARRGWWCCGVKQQGKFHPAAQSAESVSGRKCGSSSFCSAPCRSVCMRHTCCMLQHRCKLSLSCC